jgi:hypothetical protein
VLKTSADNTTCCFAGCMGFLYANATSATRRLLGVMLREKLHQMDLHEVKYYNDQRVLNEQLVQVGDAWYNLLQ